ncbi:MAG: RNase adapter RapZ [Litorivicinus sp.]
MRLVVISGRSGSGKSAALGSLEDAGYTCIDNLPVGVLPATLSILDERSQTKLVAVGIDARSRAEDIAVLPHVLEQLDQNNIHTRILWLDANPDTLVARFHATRRRHPLLGESGSLEQALASEEALLDPIMQAADRHLDTTSMSVHELRSAILTLADPDYQPPKTAVHIMSFGFKYGAPTTVDYVFDARFLPNPYWKPELRSQTGQDPDVQAFLGEHADTGEYLGDIEAMIRRWAPLISQSGRPSVTVAIGCTGGQHRSVYLVEMLKQRLSESFDISHRHRELRE